ncbi:MAG: T9SS type A sorting domain-containing protein, partial [Saprospiraceae bacterium]|nr:T9SS type A sorting domain-containing protein [Saprospiraceae bacterium]
PLSGSNYYRLKQVDFDGRYEFSEIRRVDIFGSLTVSNRTNAIANIGLGERMSFEYQVINTNGVVVQIGQEEQAIGNVDVDLSGLPNGIYYLRIVSDDSKVNQSFPIHKVN